MRLYIGKSNDILCFWTRMGKHLTDRSICNELGDKIYDNGNIVWFLMGVKPLYGFCCAEDKKTHVQLKHDYIFPKFRGKKYYKRLFEKRLNHFNNGPFEIVSKTPQVLHTAELYNFYEKSKRGSYTVMRRDR